MGLIFLLFAIQGFGIGTFWVGGITLLLMNDKNVEWNSSLPLAAIAGILGGVCGAVVGLGIAYIVLRSY